MGLSEGQKKRRYGENTKAPQEIRTPAPATPSQPARSMHDMTRQELAAEPERSSSFMFAGVAFVITLLLFGYYYLWVLPELSERAGTTIPELMFWFTPEHLASVSAGLGAENLVQYQFIHRSSALVLPLIFAGSWVGMIAGAKLPVITRRLNMALPVLYAVIFIAGGFVLDVTLAHAGGGPAGLAALLIALRWILLVLCLIQLGWLAVRLFRRKVDSFARGELPGQQKI